MKQYFTKYLPIEGEIKEGQTGISVNNATYTHYNHLGPGYGRPAALHLCSTDIQVGDKVVREDDPAYLPDRTIISIDERVITLSDGTKTHDHNLIKVIGRISPDATWVKEGDEFDKEELFANGVGHNWDDSHKNLKLKVKCPTCKNYH